MDKIYIGTKMPGEIKRELEHYGIIYPEAEAEERAKWIFSEENHKPICSHCGKAKWKGWIPTTEEAAEWMKYCPQCGAKMEGWEE